MFRPAKRQTGREKGALLAGALLVSTALVISMLSLLTFSRTANRQAESLLSRTELERMAQEKLTRDLLALNKNIDLKKFDVSPSTFAAGEAQSSIQAVPENLTVLKGSLYLVVVATLTRNNPIEPRHLRLETIVDLPGAVPAATPPPPGPDAPAVPLSKLVEDQLKAYFPVDDPRFEELKEQILSQLKSQLGAEADSLFVPSESTQYRDPTIGEGSPVAPEEKADTFTMSPVSLEPSTPSAKIRVWKETYY